ncbi:Choriogenin Hminor protein [Rutstroemia sp. NJR-2017a BBW]|nr:Choriogenin Hminor protein [Rutstroemia sp. NJR-2017a BBW]
MKLNRNRSTATSVSPAKSDLKYNRTIQSMSLIIEEPIPIHTFFSSRKGDEVPDWPLPKQTSTHQETVLKSSMSTAKEMGIRKWDGVGRKSTEWDGLRRDIDLWYPEGDCLVHLYARGQSRRGPAFRVPLSALLAARCEPLLERFTSKDIPQSPMSECSYASESFYFEEEYTDCMELYIPAPVMAGRGESFMYHTATRNFFAWVCQKPLVGRDLGTALVGLLNSLSEFRSKDVNNIDDAVTYIEGQGYADMRNTPDHALAIIYFAEHFHFRDMWIDAFAHCTGMSERLHESPGFEILGRHDRAFISRSRLEMDLRLDKCGKMLSTFLSSELSDSRLKLSSGARVHLEKFRSFLHSYYVAKLGTYPCLASQSGNCAFPKSIFKQMRSEFQKLYDFLVDTESFSETSPVFRGEVSVLKNIAAFDGRHKLTPLPYPLPLLPEVDHNPGLSTKQPRSTRLSFGGKLFPHTNKMQLDPRLVTIAALNKATNRRDPKLAECTLVRAYRGFEKECVYPLKTGSADTVSPDEGRKIRWILIYSTLQVLIDATKIPEQVRATQNVPYNICVRTEGCPPWTDRRSCYDLLRSQTAQAAENFRENMVRTSTASISHTPLGIMSDFDTYLSQTSRPKQSKTTSENIIATQSSIKTTAAKAKRHSAIVPELHHPRPQRRTHHEILVDGYGNGLNFNLPKSMSTAHVNEVEVAHRKQSSDSTTSSQNVSSNWSNSSYEAEGTNFDSIDADSPRTSRSFTSDSRHGSISSTYSEVESIEEMMVPRPDSAYSVSIYNEDMEQETILRESSISTTDFAETRMAPSPLFARHSLKSGIPGPHGSLSMANPELQSYLGE